MFLVSAGMVLLALFSHHGFPWIGWSALGLLVTAWTIGRNLSRAPDAASLLGLNLGPWRVVPLSVVGVGLGIWGAVLHRSALGHSPWPMTGGVFVLVACVIGMTEELVYRGWVQAAARPFGWPTALGLAALGHAAYKTALFAWPPGPIGGDLAGIAIWTLVGGIILGLLRESSKSVIPAMLAHAAFDFIVYRDVVHAPWWVWG